MKRRTVISGVAVILLLVVVAFAAGRFGGASAQEGATGWDSSAEQGAELPAPEFPAEPADPEAVISWRVAGSALRPRENDVNYLTTAMGGCIYVTAGDISTVWNIPVQLPQGALVDSLRMYFYDISPGDFTAWFTIYDLYGNIVQEWSVNSAGSTGNGFTDTGLINHTIDYSVYSYVLNWRPGFAGSATQLCGFRVFFTAPMFGAGFVPVIRNENP